MRLNTSMSDEQDNVIPIPRTTKGTFQKGVSGNPAGGNKPRIFRDLDGNKRDIQDLFRAGAPMVAKQLMEIICDSKAPPGARVNAAKTWLERAYGKPAITITAPEELDYDGLDIDEMSPELRGELLRIAQKETSGRAD